MPMTSTPKDRTEEKERVPAKQNPDTGTPSYEVPPGVKVSKQVPTDKVEEASMESFPASDPPTFTTSHV